MGVVEPDGTTRYADGSTSKLGDRSYVKAAFAGKSIISDVLISRVTKKPVIMLATPIRDNTSKVIGVLIARLDGFVLSEITDQVKYGERGYSYIINAKGELIAHGTREYVVEARNFLEEGKTNAEFRLLSAMMQNMTEGKSGFEEYWFVGFDRFFGYAPIPGTDWSIAVGAIKEDAFAGIYSMRNQIILSLIGFLLAGAIFTVFISRAISRPIVRIATALKSIALGDLNVHVEVKSKDEIGDMANSFDQMLAAQRIKAEALTALSDGDLSKDIALASTNDVVGKAIQNMTAALKQVIERNSETCRDQKQGDLDARNELTGLNGEYRTLAGGVNEALDSIAKPVAEGIAMLNEYAEGNLTHEMRELPGKQIAFTNGLRNIRNNLLALIADANLLAEAGVSGQLTVRADASRHQGAYAEVMQGINSIIGTLVDHINVTMHYIEDIAHGNELAEYTEQVQG
ncbi:MAG: cache domain-containing protein, partial [Kiritimatiellae bacterium]|nr:cache domain-containing protein [Kiritimatiellia bacterium]